MPEIYNQVMNEIKTLPLSDQLRLLEEITELIRIKAGDNTTRSIMELKGKGKEIWKDIDVKEYIDKERSTWTG